MTTTPSCSGSCFLTQEPARSYQARGGVRKLRWGAAGRGKRGGLRIIYFLRTKHGQIWMLTLYAKNVAESIPAHVLIQIKDEIDG
jgi:hypothetical protein